VRRSSKGPFGEGGVFDEMSEDSSFDDDDDDEEEEEETYLPR